MKEKGGDELHREVTDYIIGYISRTRKNSQQVIQMLLEEEGVDGIDPSHGTILSVLLEKEGPMQMKEIAKLTRRDKSTITSLVNRIEKEGYVKKIKSIEDRRVTYIELTERGLALKEPFFNISTRLIDIAYGEFEPEERLELLRLLKKMNKSFYKALSETR
jgi:DNA-binding MarR family transcriptional regulator